MRRRLIRGCGRECVRCLYNRTVGFTFLGHISPHLRGPRCHRPGGNLMKRPSQESLAAHANTGCPDADFLRKWPSIAEYLTCTVWEGGKARLPSTLTVSMAEGMVQIALNDKDLSRSVYTTAGTLEEALDLLDGTLHEGHVPWRAWRSGGGRQK